MMIDTHAHLDQFEDIQDVLLKASSQGVESIIAVSMNLASCKKSLEIQKRFNSFPGDPSKRFSPQIYLAMGMHPSEANLDELENCLEFVKENSCHIKAVGEIGLDFWYKWVKKDLKKKEEQIKVFSSFLELAKKLNLPVIIHSRGAWQMCLDLAKDTGIQSAVFHWYSGPCHILEQILAQGYYISAPPSLAYDPKLQECIHASPVERILLETDSPVHFLDPETQVTFRSEPRDVFRTLKAYSRLKNLNEQYAKDVFVQNAARFFQLS